MQYCKHCGQQLIDGATTCFYCGQSTIPQEQQSYSAVHTKTKSSKKIILVIAAIVLILGVIAAVLFAPRNLKMDDFKKTNIVGAIVKYGIPSGSTYSEDDGETLLYRRDKPDFYGITPSYFGVELESDEVFFFFKEDDGAEVYRKINRYCTLERKIGSSFHEFSYENLRITTYAYDGSYVRIEIN